MSDIYRSVHKVNPEWLEVLKFGAAHYKMTVNKFAVSVLSGQIFYSTGTTDSDKTEGILNRDNSRHCRQSIDLFIKLRNYSVIDQQTLALKDLHFAMQKTGSATVDEFNEQFLSTMKEIINNFAIIIKKSKSYLDDKSPESVKIREGLKSISIHKNAPKETNLFLRLPLPMKARFFRGKPESKNPKYRRSLQQFISKNLLMLSYEVTPDSLLFLSQINDRINRVNHKINIALKEGKKTGITTLVTEMLIVNRELKKYGVENGQL